MQITSLTVTAFECGWWTKNPKGENCPTKGNDPHSGLTRPPCSLLRQHTNGNFVIVVVSSLPFSLQWFGERLFIAAFMLPQSHCGALSYGWSYIAGFLWEVCIWSSTHESIGVPMTLFLRNIKRKKLWQSLLCLSSAKRGNFKPIWGQFAHCATKSFKDPSTRGGDNSKQFFRSIELGSPPV